MLLSICILGAGVYAANTTDRHMGISGGVIQVPINLLGVSVEGYIGTDTTKTPDFTSSYDDNTKDSTWSLMEADGKTSKLVFDAERANVETDVTPITLTFVITNESDVALEAYFYNSEDEQKTKITNDYLGGSNNSENYVVGVALGSGDLAAATYKQDNTLDVAGTCTITMTFTLNKLLDDGGNYDFSYVLQVQEQTQQAN